MLQMSKMKADRFIDKARQLFHTIEMNAVKQCAENNFKVKVAKKYA